MSIKVINGNCLEMLDQLPEQSVNTCVTSPPYWGLRDYGTAEWIGGDDNCEHTINHYSDNLKPDVDRPFRGNRSACIKCGAIRKDNQLGLEDTPEEYVENMVAVFREVKRVLRDDGTVWLNLGDSYASQGGAVPEQTLRGNKNIVNSHQLGKDGVGTSRVPPKNLKPKDLVGIPWMVAFALRADGWYLRQDIIWHKPNPMPESVTDRCTKSHEYIFLLTKNKKYYYDNEAIKEDAVYDKDLGILRSRKQAELNHPSIIKRQEIGIDSTNAGDGKRNKRSVWTVTTKPFKGAHFATFPPDLIEPCVLAGCPEKICVECGTPYEREMEVIEVEPKENINISNNRKEFDSSMGGGGTSLKGHSGHFKEDGTPVVTPKKDLGFKKQCDCEFGSCPKCKKPYAVVEKKHRKEIIEYRNLPNHDELRTYLKEYRSKSGMTIDEIEQHFGTQAPHHWFEKGGSYPDKDDWTQLKELLSLDNTHDQAMTEVFEKSGYKGETEYIDKGLQKQCQCESNETKAGTVLDPFGGSGTTGLVADRNGRNAILIELNDEYAEMARDRLYNDAPLFVDIE